MKERLKKMLQYKYDEVGFVFNEHVSDYDE
jgi:hypothetical protein